MTTSRRYPTPPNLNQLLADPLVREELARAWSESNPDAAEVPKGQPGSVKCEQGGFIYWNQDTEELEVERLPSGTRDGLGGEPAELELRQLVGSFHTHPNTTAEGYTADPSPADRYFTMHVSACS